VADLTAPTETQAQACASCGQPVRSATELGGDAWLHLTRPVDGHVATVPGAGPTHTGDELYDPLTLAVCGVLGDIDWTDFDPKNPNDLAEVAAIIVSDDRITVDDEEPEEDLSSCAWYQRVTETPGADPNGTCSFGCREEPACQTSEPDGGWPSQRVALIKRLTDERDRLRTALERIRGWDDITPAEYDAAIADDANTCTECRAVEIALTALAGGSTCPICKGRGAVAVQGDPENPESCPANCPGSQGDYTETEKAPF
jgi:hypothetical protein